MHVRRIHWVGGLVVLLAAAAGVTAVSAALRGEGRIAFDDGRTFPSKIGTMNADGSDVRIISERGDQWPRWSFDGEQIVFFTTRNAAARPTPTPRST